MNDNNYIYTSQDIYEFVRDNDIQSLKQALEQKRKYHNSHRLQVWHQCQGNL